MHVGPAATKSRFKSGVSSKWESHSTDSAKKMLSSTLSVSAFLPGKGERCEGGLFGNEECLADSGAAADCGGPAAARLWPLRRTASAALGPTVEADDARRTAADASEDASSRDCASCARVPTVPPVLREQQAKGATYCGPRCSIFCRESRAQQADRDKTYFIMKTLRTLQDCDPAGS
jgi:hypothetical protein